MCLPKSTISAYENDKVDIKSSVIAELSRHLATKPDYLLGFETGEDSYVITATAILQGIKDEKIKALLIGQMKAARKLGMQKNRGIMDGAYKKIEIELKIVEFDNKMLILYEQQYIL